jgi:hypothetical protein
MPGEDRVYDCAICGAVIDVPEEKIPSVTLIRSSDERTVRIVRVDGEEIHRCGVGLNDPTPRRRLSPS